MNIAKLNPVGYQSKTNNGNVYQKSNIAKTSALITGIGLSVLTHTSKKPILKAFSTKSLLQDIFKELNIKKTKINPVFLASAILLDIAGFFIIGSYIDKQINKKRAEKADLKN